MRGKAKHRSQEQIEHDIKESYKTCVKCLHRKHFDNFTDQSKAPDGKCNTCRDCLKKYRQETKQRQQAWSKQYNKKNGEYIRYKRLNAKYGVDKEWYDETLKKQNYSCAICKGTDVKGNGKKHFHVDHNHKTGKVRGLLCSHCNTAIGKLQESEEILINALEYLKFFNK
jgi:hypothetical protein